MSDASTQPDYTSADLKHLSDREHVRERFGMYIGDNTSRGLHHLVYEVVDNSIDECMAGHAKHVSVMVNVDGSVTVEDDGRGIPVDRHPQLSEEMDRDVSTLEGVMTVLKFGGKFEKGAYQTSGGLHGVGVTVVNFLSEWCEVEVSREGHLWQQEYQRGEPTGPVRKMGTTPRTGTKTTFKPDPQIFPQTKFSWDVLAKRLQELAFLNSGVRITFADAASNQREEYHYERGVVEFIEWLNRSSVATHSDVISIQGAAEGVSWDIALQYTGEFTENLHSYVNNISTTEGGTHVSGFRAALTRVLNAYGKKADIYKDLVPTGEDVREGLTAVVSVRVPHPQFEGQTKTKLGNGEVEGIINSAAGDFLTKYLEEHPGTAKAILRRILLAAEAREAAKKAREAIRKVKGIGGSLPGKLRDCTSRDIARCELYLVEGDSAGGSAEGGRHREYQAILPLRGKIINAYKSRTDKVLANEEVRSLIGAIGSGIGDEVDLGKRRYDKIVIMTDADVDGSHIRTLLLTFFYRQMYQLVAAGHVYVAQPPLFRVRSKKTVYYVQTEEEMKTQLLDQGLGEGIFLPGDGREIAGDAMQKLCRTLAGLEDALVSLEKRGISLRDHAGRRDSTTGKLPMYHVYYGVEEQWFTSRDALESFVKGKEKAAGGELAVGRVEEAEAVGDTTPGTAPDTGDDQLVVVDLHEVRSINAGLKELDSMGFGIESLLPQDRTGTEEPRYLLRRGENEIGLEDLRGLLTAVRRAGEKGLTITRFKGLGEMNAEELRDTTLDPANRTLVRITMTDAANADDLFRVLMGEQVEPRRDFIERHALDVKNLDV
jgi:DNA gyrase subunit B